MLRVTFVSVDNLHGIVPKNDINDLDKAESTHISLIVIHAWLNLSLGHFSILEYIGLDRRIACIHIVTLISGLPICSHIHLEATGLQRITMQIVLEDIAVAVTAVVIQLPEIIERVDVVISFPAIGITIEQTGFIHGCLECLHVAGVVLPMVGLVDTDKLHRGIGPELRIRYLAIHEAAVDGIFRAHIVDAVLGGFTFFGHDKFALLIVCLVFECTFVEQSVERVADLAAVIGQVLGKDVDGLYLACPIGMEFEERLSVAVEGEHFAFVALAESGQLFGHAVVQMEATQAIAIDKRIGPRFVVQSGNKTLAVPHVHPCRQDRHELFVVVERLSLHHQGVAFDIIKHTLVPFRLEPIDFIVADAIQEEGIGHHFFHGGNGQHAVRGSQYVVLVDVGLHGLLAAVEAALVDQHGQPTSVFQREAIHGEPMVASVFHIQPSVHVVALAVAEMAVAVVGTGVGLRLETFVQVLLGNAFKHLKSNAFVIDSWRLHRRVDFLFLLFAKTTVADK